MCPMSHEETGEAVSHQYGRRRTSLHGNIQRTNPIVTGWTVPIVQIHPLPIGMAQLPERLPMLWAGVAKTGKNEHRRIYGHLIPRPSDRSQRLWRSRWPSYSDRWQTDNTAQGPTAQR